MKVTFFSDCYLDLTGGIVSSINAQKTALENDGHEVLIFSTGFPRSESERRDLAQKQIYQVPSCKLFFRGLTPVSRRPGIVEKWLLEKHPELKEFDIFYVHYESGCSIAALRLGRKLGIPTIQVMHGREDMGETNLIPRGFRTIVAILINWFHSWYLSSSTRVKRDDYYADSLAKAKMWELMVRHANAADLVLTPSEHFREKLIRYGVVSPIKVFPNGYPDDKFPDKVSLKSLAKDGELKIIWHSRVSAEKRMMPFLRALSKVNGKYHLDVYGGGGDYFRAKRYAKCHHMNVTFHGNTAFERVQSAIASSQLDVLVSYNFDTFGMTLIEAEAHGVPVFICDPDMKEVIPKGSYIISKNENPAEMTKALNTIFKHPDCIAKMSEVMLAHRDEILISKRIKLLEKIFNSAIMKA
ncbi:glycosyltransferase [Candidatus Saccharibacteria bacterium]|nr:glycosyltransferase [Candidatus Saccharibacteria bacterium]